MLHSKSRSVWTQVYYSARRPEGSAFPPLEGGGHALPPGLLAHLRAAPDLSGVNARDDQRLMLWSTPYLDQCGRRSTIPLADLREARFRPWRRAETHSPQVCSLISGPLLISEGVNARDDQRLMLWSTPNLNKCGRRSPIPLADLREARFRPRRGAETHSPQAWSQ